MASQIYNMGVYGGILEAAEKYCPESLTEKDKERLKYLRSLPKNQWINLDENGKMISKEEAEKREIEKLKRFQTPDGKSII